MKELYKIEDFFTEVDDNFALAAESPLDGETYEIVSDDDFFDAVSFEYGERSIYIPETDTPKVTFKRMWDAFVRQRGSQFAAAFGALLTEYKPLENYSMIETHTGTETGVKTPTNWKTVQTPTGWKEVKRPLNWQEAVTQTPNNWKTTLTKSASNDYKETDAEKPTNWKSTLTKSASNDYKETDTDKPTNWVSTLTKSASNDYKETDTDKPTNWTKTTERENGAENAVTESNTIFAVNSSTAVPTSGRSVQTLENIAETQGGTYAHEKTFVGELTDETAQTGTFAHEKTFEGEFIEETEQSGQFSHEKTFAGELIDETAQTGTMTTETTTSGTFETEQQGTFATEQQGTFEDEMTYDTELTRSGNVGVTTSQQMLTSEVQVRMIDLIKIILSEFFNKYTIYV